MSFHRLDFEQEDTIVGLSTPPEPSLRGIVRISGNNALEITQSLMNNPGINLHNQSTYSWMETELILEETANTKFPGTLFLMKSPRSYTCEDVVEIHFPGSLGLADLLIEALIENGARLAEPGEFTERAFLNGRIDLTQAEAVLQCIQAESEQELSLAHDQLQGVLSQKIQDLSDRLLDLCSYVEASLDFSDQDIEVISREQILSYLSPIVERIQQAVEEGTTQNTMSEDLCVSFSGAPNVGKSSLFNQFIQEDRAIVTEIAGTTRDVIEGTLSFSSSSLKLLDTAGVGELEDPTADALQEKIFERTKNALKRADLILHVQEAPECLKSDSPLSYPDHFPNGTPIFFICNKMDQLSPDERRTLQSRIDQTSHDVFYTSAIQNEGISTIRNALESWLQHQGSLQARKVKLNRRHIQHLERTLDHLNRASEAVQTKRPEELIAADLRNALDELRAITGEGSVEDILDRIFGEFCIGK